MSITKIELAKIRLDVTTQLRVRCSQEDLEEYIEFLRDGTDYQPVVVYHDSRRYWLADGLPWVKAAKSLNLTELEADVRPGTKRDALLFAACVGDNLNHGLRMTLADKREAAELLLSDPEWYGRSNREIGRRCGLDGKTVADIKLFVDNPQMDQSPTSAEHPQTKTVKCTRRGKTYEMKVGVREKDVTVPKHLLGAFEAIAIWRPWTPKDDWDLIEDLKWLPISELASPDAVLWFWVDTHDLPDALYLAEKWKFVYWDLLTRLEDVHMTPGAIQSQAEHCLIAVRGEFYLTIDKHVFYKEGAAKEPFYELVEKVCPGPKAELFASENRDGWVYLGDKDRGFAWDEMTLEKSCSVEEE